MLRIDVATPDGEAIIELAGRNPLQRDGPARQRAVPLRAEQHGRRGRELGGIRRFDTMTSTAQLLVRERDVGGASPDRGHPDGCGAAIVVASPGEPERPRRSTRPRARVLSTFAAPCSVPPRLTSRDWSGGTAKLYVGDRRRASNGKVSGARARVDRGMRFETPAIRRSPQPPVGLRAARQ